MERLQWNRAPGDAPGFRAYPDGIDKPHRYAAIWQEAGYRHGKWRWLVRIDPPDRSPGDFTSGEYRNGVEDTKQQAADAATEAWREMIGTET